MIQREIKKYDCHQTSLAVQKKVLLLMFIERELGIAMEDDEPRILRIWMNWLTLS